MKDKRVCYIHGGRSTGAPKGNRNAWKTGAYSAEVREETNRVREFRADCQKLLEGLGAALGSGKSRGGGR